jgi:hypothetical protein
MPSRGESPKSYQRVVDSASSSSTTFAVDKCKQQTRHQEGKRPQPCITCLRRDAAVHPCFKHRGMLQLCGACASAIVCTTVLAGTTMVGDHPSAVQKHTRP